jgi:hypothetical protein
MKEDHSTERFAGKRLSHSSKLAIVKGRPVSTIGKEAFVGLVNEKKTLIIAMIQVQSLV